MPSHPIANILLERRACLLCIASKVGAKTLDVVRSVENMARIVRVDIERAVACSLCDSTLGPVYSMSRISGGRDDDDLPRCAGCGRAILAAQSVGGTSGRLLHLDCYLRERDAARALDPSALAPLIADAALCRDCLTLKSGAPGAQIDDAIARLAETIKVTTRMARCDACRKERVTYRLG